MSVSRRQILGSGLTAAAAASMAATPLAAAVSDAPSFRFCLNTSTIREPKLGIEREVDIAAEAGYDSIEPWIPTLREFVSGGGRLSDLRKRIADHGLTVESAIGFAAWIVDDESARQAALEEARRDMDMLKAIGGIRIAAPPVGAHGGDAPMIELAAAAERYRALLEIGDEAGVVPQLEVWGFSKNLSRLGETLYVASEAAHPSSCMLLDVYHLYKGGSEFAALPLLSDSALQVFHLNDYPADPPRSEIGDAHRVYPGDGIAPLTEILKAIGGQGRSIVLSLELFNRDYWKQDPLLVARTGLEKMKAAVAAAGEH